MASVALVDSNVFISLLRARIDPVSWLGQRFEDVYTCGMVRLEVLRGQKSVGQRKALESFFNVLCNVPTDNSLWEEATELAWQLDRKGRVLPAQDVIIACCARRAGVPVLTGDHHFREVPGISVIPFLED